MAKIKFFTQPLVRYRHVKYLSIGLFVSHELLSVVFGLLGRNQHFMTTRLFWVIGISYDHEDQISIVNVGLNGSNQGFSIVLKLHLLGSIT